MAQTKLACITLDLEPDHAGQIPTNHSLWQPQYFHRLISLLDHYQAPISCFVVTSSLSHHLNSIKPLRDYSTHFYLHSHHHNLNDPDSEKEIVAGITAFKKYFHQAPIGYRAPQALISPTGLKLLQRHGFLFDASESPSFWPSITNLSLKPLAAYQPLEGLWEIPFSVISPFRLLFTLSWIKLIGWPNYSFLLKRSKLPHQLVFNLHLHDFWQPIGFDQLSPFWKFIYGRYQNEGFTYFTHVLNFLQSQGYHFVNIEKLIP